MTEHKTAGNVRLARTRKWTEAMKISKTLANSALVKVCKTFIREFESRSRLQTNPNRNPINIGHNRTIKDSLIVARPVPKTAQNGEDTPKPWTVRGHAARTMRGQYNQRVIQAYWPQVNRPTYSPFVFSSTRYAITRPLHTVGRQLDGETFRGTKGEGRRCV